MKKTSFHNMELSPGQEHNELRIDVIRQVTETYVDGTTTYYEDVPYHSVGLDLSNGLFYDMNGNLSFRLDYLSSVEGRIEQFCNAFAGSFLVPAAQLESAAEDLPDPTDERGLVSLSYKFSVGKHVILRRFLDLGWIDQPYYRQKTAEWEKQWSKAKKPQGGPVRQEVKSISQRGRRFSSLIVEAADRGLIAPPTLYEGLGVRTKYLSDVRAQLTA